jgi:hypothetical protein
MKAQKKGKGTPKFTEFTVKIRIKPERLEWFSGMSDQLGLTRDQAVSGMLESNMGADSRGIGIEEAQKFIIQGASALFPERKLIQGLERAFDSLESAERTVEKAKGAALIDLHEIAPKEMGLAALYQAKSALLRVATSKRRSGKRVTS